MNIDYNVIEVGLTMRQAIAALDRGEWVRHEMMPDFMCVRKHDNETYDYENDQYVYIDEFWEYWGAAEFAMGWMIIEFNY